MNVIRILPWYYAATVVILESLVTLVALIFGMAVRVMIQNDAIFVKNVSIVTYQEIINFLISGSMAYLAWIKGFKALQGR